MTKSSRRFAVALLAGVHRLGGAGRGAISAGARAARGPAAEGQDQGGRRARVRACSADGRATLTQVGSSAPYKFEIAITAQGGETKYPELDCIGKLIRVGQSRSYVFFVELITKGHADKGGRCPDGTITVARAGDKLALSDGSAACRKRPIVAYGTLAKK